MTNNITLEQIENIRSAFHHWAFSVADLGVVKSGGKAHIDAQLDALDAAVEAIENGTASGYAIGMLIGYLGHAVSCTAPDSSGVMRMHRDYTVESDGSPTALAAAGLQAAVLATMPPVTV